MLRSLHVLHQVNIKHIVKLIIINNVSNVMIVLTLMHHSQIDSLTLSPPLPFSIGCCFEFLVLPVPFAVLIILCPPYLCFLYSWRRSLPS